MENIEIREEKKVEPKHSENAFYSLGVDLVSQINVIVDDNLIICCKRKTVTVIH